MPPPDSPAAPASAPDADEMLDWVALTDGPLPVEDASAWVRRPDCGAVVTFAGLVRDHAEGRPGVTGLEYEAYEEHVVARMAEVVGEARSRWGSIAKVAVLHRVGALAVGDAAVVVAVSAPHRDHAFEAARYCIDTVKATAPIWKRERWSGGEDWGTDATPVADPVTRSLAERSP